MGYIICPDLHSCERLHYMKPLTFMSRRTLYACPNIHFINPYTRGLINPMHHGIHDGSDITCQNHHSWFRKHYMYWLTFITNSLAEGFNKGIGSWHPAHCMWGITFMRPVTLHGTPYIHAVCGIICIHWHSCEDWHFMNRHTFMWHFTLHAL